MNNDLLQMAGAQAHPPPQDRPHGRPRCDYLVIGLLIYLLSGCVQNKWLVRMQEVERDLLRQVLDEEVALRARTDE